MNVEEKAVQEFQKLYVRAYGKPIETGEAREMARRLLMLFELLIRQLPSPSPQRKIRKCA